MIFPIHCAAPGDTRWHGAGSTLKHVALEDPNMHDFKSRSKLLETKKYSKLRNPRRNSQCWHRGTKEERRVAMTWYLFWNFPFSLNGLLIPLFPWVKLALGGTTLSFHHHQSPLWNGVPAHFTGSQLAHGRSEIAGMGPQFSKQN